MQESKRLSLQSTRRASRLQESRPFAVTGVDFTGACASETANMNPRFTFVCSPELPQGQFMRPVSANLHSRLPQIASRRSLTNVISDNASTYLSAANELKKLFDSTTIRQTFSRQGVKWKFIPKRAPWYVGFWERLIGLTKTALKKMLGRASINLITLQTIIVETEAILNDRPLTYISPDFEDQEPPTPSHLLYGRRITTLPHPSTDTDEVTDPDYGDDARLRKHAARVVLLSNISGNAGDKNTLHYFENSTVLLVRMVTKGSR